MALWAGLSVAYVFQRTLQTNHGYLFSIYKLARMAKPNAKLISRTDTSCI